MIPRCDRVMSSAPDKMDRSAFCGVCPHSLYNRVTARNVHNCGPLSNGVGDASPLRGEGE
jgi:hypothetical protein